VRNTVETYPQRLGGDPFVPDGLSHLRA
jgi:hypothetical protein